MDATAVLSKSDEAYQQLMQMIHTGQIGAGEPLTEAKASRLTGLSRGPVRESILRLEAEGLLRQRGSRRSRVVGVLEDEDRDDVLYRYEARESIESAAARLAAKNMNGWQIDRLRELAVELSQFFAIDRDQRRHQSPPPFHDYLLENCGNPLLYRIWKTHQLTPSSPGSRRTSELLKAQIPEAQRSQPGWIDVADAIAQHDENLAEQLTKQRIRIIIDAIRRLSWDEITGNKIEKGVGATEADG